MYNIGLENVVDLMVATNLKLFESMLRYILSLVI